MAGETEPERQAQLCLRNACALREHIELHAPRWRVERVAAAAARWSRTLVDSHINNLRCHALILDVVADDPNVREDEALLDRLLEIQARAEELLKQSQEIRKCFLEPPSTRASPEKTGPAPTDAQRDPLPKAEGNGSHGDSAPLFAQANSALPDSALPPPLIGPEGEPYVVQYEDISAEVVAKLMERAKKRAESKAAETQIKRKRKRPSTESLSSLLDAMEGLSPAKRPKKKPKMKLRRTSGVESKAATVTTGASVKSPFRKHVLPEKRRNKSISNTKIMGTERSNDAADSPSGEQGSDSANANGGFELKVPKKRIKTAQNGKHTADATEPTQDGKSGDTDANGVKRSMSLRSNVTEEEQPTYKKRRKVGQSVEK